MHFAPLEEVPVAISKYAVVYGIPLPLIGMVAYGAAAFLALKLASKDFPFGIDESNGGLVLLGITTSMATASAYFLYILSTQFPGASCSYCLVSVLLSFSLFFTTAKILGWQKIQEEVGLFLRLTGIPLPLIGMVACGAAAFLALKLASKDFPFGIDESNGGLILLGTTTSMATASAYF